MYIFTWSNWFSLTSEMNKTYPMDPWQFMEQTLWTCENILRTAVGNGPKFGHRWINKEMYIHYSTKMAAKNSYLFPENIGMESN